jgi:ribonuclease D
LDKAPQSKHIYVDTDEAMKSLLEHMDQSGSIALDTEADSLYHYYHKVCLIQLTIDDQNYILDPLSKIDFKPFLKLLVHKPMILHDAGYDLRMMWSSFGFKPRGKLLDTMLAAQLLGYQYLGLAAMLEKFFDISISKIGQRWDWSERPLPARKIEYAICDTHYLPELARILTERLEKLGRLDWHAESCIRLIDSATQDKPEVDPERVWRIKGARHLDPLTLTVLKNIWHWRDSQAQKADLPPFKIMINASMIALAGWSAGHPKKSLRSGPRLPRNCVGKRQELLKKTIADAHKLPKSEWEQHPKSPRGKRPSPTAQQIAESIKEDCMEIASELELAPQIIAPRAAINAIANNRPGSIEEIVECSGLTVWQSKLIEEAVSKAIAKFHPKKKKH